MSSPGIKDGEERYWDRGNSMWEAQRREDQAPTSDPFTVSARSDQWKCEEQTSRQSCSLS